MNEMNYEKVLAEAFKAMENAYAPYSNYHVGSFCVELKNGGMIWGANVENASYGLTNCAERNAIFAAYSQGYRKDDIRCLAIVSDGERIGTPCGACRQVLSELLGNEIPIILSNGKDTMVTNMQELLPFQFSSEDLDK